MSTTNSNTYFTPNVNTVWQTESFIRLQMGDLNIFVDTAVIKRSLIYPLETILLDILFNSNYLLILCLKAHLRLEKVSGKLHLTTMAKVFLPTLFST